MSDLGSIVGIDGENINLNLLSVNDLENILKDVKKRETQIKKEIDDILDYKKGSSKEIMQIDLTSEGLTDAKVAIEGRNDMGDASDVIKGIESFKLTVMKEIRKQLNGNEEGAKTGENKQVAKEKFMNKRKK